MGVNNAPNKDAEVSEGDAGGADGVAVVVGATNRMDAASSAPTDEPLPTDSIAR